MTAGYGSSVWFRSWHGCDTLIVDVDVDVDVDIDMHECATDPGTDAGRGGDRYRGSQSVRTPHGTDSVP